MDLVKKLISLNPELHDIFENSINATERQYYWEKYREATGSKMKDLYIKYVHLNNEAAKLSGYKDASIMKVNEYDSNTFQEEMEETWLGLKPLYVQLHA